MSSNELSESLPDDTVDPAEPAIAGGSTEVGLSDGVSAGINGVAALQETDGVATDFGALEEVAARSYVRVDLDEIRSRLDAAYMQQDESDGTKEMVNSTGSGDRECENSGLPDGWAEDVGDDQQAATGDGSAGLPPDDPPVEGAADDDLPNPEDELEKRAAIAEAGNLIGHIGRITHGPESEPLTVDNDDSTIAVALATAGDRIEDVGLTQESVIGRRVRTEHMVDDLDIRLQIEAEALSEEVIPLAEELDRQVGEGRTPVARINVIAEPQGIQYADTDETERSISHPSASITVWVGRGLQSDAYVDTFAMDRDAGERMEAFLSRLGFSDVHVLEPDQGEFDDTYYADTRSEVLMQVNRFMRDLLR
jgi:hypothetical protein